MTHRLFERVITLCSLSPLIGPGTVRRALRDVGAEPATATLDDYCRSIPRLEARLRSFLGEEEAALRARSILQLRNVAWSTAPDNSGGNPGAGGPPSSPREVERTPESASRWISNRTPPGALREQPAEDGARDERKAMG